MVDDSTRSDNVELEGLVGARIFKLSASTPNEYCRNGLIYILLIYLKNHRNSLLNKVRVIRFFFENYAYCCPNARFAESATLVSATILPCEFTVTAVLQKVAILCKYGLFLVC
jgi:hypothetical protein